VRPPIQIFARRSREPIFVANIVIVLQDPSVASAPLDKRIAFLNSKNLTQDEINVALSRAGNPEASNGPVGQPSYTYGGAPQPPPGYGGYPGGYWQPPPPEYVEAHVKYGEWRD
jgi:peroxin-14